MDTTPLAPEPVRLAPPAEPTASLEEVDIRSELLSRPHRPRDWEGEDRAFGVLAKEMAENPRNMLQKLVETAVELCKADTAGISLLEGEVFRWEAVAGTFASYRNGTMPRGASPCGVCIDRNATQLMHLPDRCFPALLTEPRFVEALLIPFHDHGTPVGTVWIVAHGHERKFDREDERIVTTLAQFASAGWQLWKAYEAAARLNEVKDGFLAMLGHEFRNPLAAIRSATEVLERVGATEFAVRRAVPVFKQQGQHLRRMVDDVLDLSRAALGKLELQTRPVELQAVVTEAVETARADLARRRHRLSLEMSVEPIHVQADPVRLEQLLANLLDNAVKYTPNGGEVAVAVQPRGGSEVCITVRDTGIGIPQDRFESIFDLFTQLGGSADRPRGGLGLGLSLVRNLVELHGGTVHAASEGPGRGSLFTVMLPTIPSLPSGAAPWLPSKTSRPRPHRILLVEDNEAVAESFGLALALEGHWVRIARDGPTALEMFKTFGPDVVLLDVRLPGMDGYEVARRMRAQTGRANVRIVTVSGYGQAHDYRRSREAGCDLHLVKPVEIDALFRLLEAVEPTEATPNPQPIPETAGETAGDIAEASDAPVPDRPLKCARCSTMILDGDELVYRDGDLFHIVCRPE